MRPVTDLKRKVAPFKVVTDMVPAGDQPTAPLHLPKPTPASPASNRPSASAAPRMGDLDAATCLTGAAIDRSESASEQMGGATTSESDHCL